MELKNRVMRFAVALTIAGAIATQIPMNGGTALARDGYGGRGGSGSTGRNIIRGVAAIAVGYGLYSTATSPSVPGGGGTGGGPQPLPSAAPTDDKKDNNEALWDVLNSRDDMTKFAQLADLAGLKEELRKPGDFTAFIPNNAAFADLGDAKLQELSKPENKAMLAQLLGSHILVGRHTIDQLKAEVKGLPDGKQYATINGKSVTVKLAGDVLTIGDIRVIETDVPASNAVIHPIGRVLDLSAPAAAPGATAAPAGTAAPVAAAPSDIVAPTPTEAPATP